MADARFQDVERPLRLIAETAEDLPPLAALMQDAVARVGDVAFLGKRRRFVILLNRFRWEDKARAEGERRAYERVRALLEVENVLAARAHGVDATAQDAALSLLDLAFDPGEDGTGTLRLILAGGGEIALEIEALDLRLSDMTRPWEARSAPDHDV